MPKRKCTAQEEVQNLNLRAAESRNKIGRRRVELTMQNCPSAIPRIVELLTSLGYTDERIAVKEQMPESFQQQARKQKSKREPVDATTAPKEDPDEAPSPSPTGSSSLADPIPGTYWRVDALSRTLLRDKLVSTLDPQAWSKANLRTALEKLGTERNKTELLRLFEFSTGFPPELALTGEMRDFGKLRDICVSRAQARGRHALSVTLPAECVGQGLYRLEGFDEQQLSLLVVHRFTDAKVQITTSKLPPTARSPT